MNATRTSLLNINYITKLSTTIKLRYTCRAHAPTIDLSPTVHKSLKGTTLSYLWVLEEHTCSISTS